MVVFKNRNDPELSEANRRARLSQSKELLKKNIHPVTLTSFLFNERKIFTVATLKNPQND